MSSYISDGVCFVNCVVICVDYGVWGRSYIILNFGGWGMGGVLGY